GAFSIVWQEMRSSSKDDLQPQLDGTRSAGTEHRVRAGHVRCFGPEAETRAGRPRRIGKGIVAARPSIWIRDIRMIENVEELGPELSGQAVLELPALCHGQIPVVVGQASEHITAERAIAAKRRRNENGAARRVTTPVRERCHTQWPRGAGLRQTIRIA